MTPFGLTIDTYKYIWTKLGGGSAFEQTPTIFFSLIRVSYPQF